MHSGLKKKILILGGSSDVGRTLIDLIDEKNYKIYLHYKSKKPNTPKKNVTLLKKDFSKITFKNCATFLNPFKNFDIIVNFIGYIDNKSFLKTNYRDIIKSLNSNFLSQLLIYKYSINHMKKKKYGRIINCSSIGVKYGGGINNFNYSLSKHCSEFVPSEMRQLAKYNILFNNIRLGVVDTKIHSKILRKKIKDRVKKIPIKRLANKKEIADYIFNLIDKNTFISSETLSISGGE